MDVLLYTRIVTAYSMIELQTHWDLTNMIHILQTTLIYNACSWMQMFTLWFNTQLSMLVSVLMSIFQI